MAEADKPDSSTGKAKSKSSFLDEDISKDFLSSWKSMSVTGGDDMDFNFEPVTKGKNKAFNFGMDMDFSLDDDAFGKMPSFNLDMPDIDFSSSPKKSSKSKEKKPEVQSAEESRQEKNGKFTFSFDFNRDGDNNENGKDGTMVIADAEPHGGQAKKDELHLLENEKTSINVNTSGDGPSSEGNGQRLHDNPSLRGQELIKGDSVVEKREKNADILRDDDNNENEEIRTRMVVDSVSCDGQAEKDELHLPDNRKTSIDVKPSREKKISFVEAFGKIPTFKLDLPVADMYGSIKKSAKLKEKLSEKKSAMGNHQEKSDKLSSPSLLTETINAGPIIEEERVVGVVETLGHDNFILDTAACSATNIPKSMISEVVSTAEMQRSGLKDFPVPSESDDPSRDEQSLDDNTSSFAKEILIRESAVEEREKNSHILRDVETNANEDSRTNKTVHPVPRDGQAKNDGLHLLDNMKTSTDDKSSGIRLPSLVTSKGVPKSSNQGNEKFKEKISRMPTVQKSNLAQVNKLPLARSDKMMPSLPTLPISRNITPSKQSSSTILQDPSPMGNLEKSSKLQVRSKMTSPVNAQKQTPSMPSLKRKPAEAADLLPSKRLSPSGSRTTKVSAKEFEDKAICSTFSGVQKQSALFEGSRNDVLAESSSPKFDFRLDASMENLDFTLMVEGDVNVEKAEACAKELDNICNMLKKKHDEAKELLVRALVNNNNLLMLNHPIYEEKICMVQRFASRLMSREQEAGV